jgi:hypothetical protein
MHGPDPTGGHEGQAGHSGARSAQHAALSAQESTCNDIVTNKRDISHTHTILHTQQSQPAAMCKFCCCQLRYSIVATLHVIGNKSFLPVHLRVCQGVALLTELGCLMWKAPCAKFGPCCPHLRSRGGLEEVQPEPLTVQDVTVVCQAGHGSLQGARGRVPAFEPCVELKRAPQQNLLTVHHLAQPSHRGDLIQVLLLLVLFQELGALEHLHGAPHRSSPAPLTRKPVDIIPHT